MAVSREDVERALAWVRDLREQVQRMDGPWLPMGFVEVPDARPLIVIEKIVQEALERANTKQER